MKVSRNLSVTNLENDCKSWKKNPGYLGLFNGCNKNLRLNKLAAVWQVIVPEPTPRCWSTVKKDEDPKCHTPVPGFGHPHVVMMDDYLYTLSIDLL